MRIFPVQETMAESILKEIVGKPKEKVLFGFLARPKEYVNCKELSEKGYKLIYFLDDLELDLSLEDFWNREFDLYKYRGLWLPDKKLGRARAIFNYKGENKLHLDYDPEFLRWGSLEELTRKNIPLKRIDKEGKKLKLPFGYYFLRY